jgi:hypothetical protein
MLQGCYKDVRDLRGERRANLLQGCACAECVCDEGGEDDGQGDRGGGGGGCYA